MSEKLFLNLNYKDKIMKKYLGIDIGGTDVKLGIINERGEILRKAKYGVNFDQYKTPILDTVLLKSKEFLSDEEIAGIGVSATGQIDDKSGTVIGTSGFIPNYLNSPIKEALIQLFNKPVEVANDGNCMIIGERWLNKIECQNIIGVVIGTGIGGGIIVNNHILSGDRGIAGEIGQITVNGGKYEDLASTRALVERIGKLVEEKNINGKWIFEHLDNPLIKEEYDLWLNDVAIGLVSLIHIFNPSCIVIGGGISVQTELFIKPLESKIKQLALPRFSEQLVIQAASLGNDAGMIGAIANLLKKN